MGLYRNRDGVVVSVSEDEALNYGYTPVSSEEQSAALRAEGVRERGEGPGGAVNTGLRNLAAGATLGISNVAIGGLASDVQREQILAEEESHPVVGGVANVIGSIAPAIVSGGTALPAGYLSSRAGAAAASGLAQGGIRGTAKVLAAGGVEGAIQNAGQYIGQAALADREVTAEGLAGAAGIGFGFGAAGGGLALGVEKGTIAARRMFPRVMGASDEAVQDAAIAWRRQAEDALAADEATVTAARRELDQIRGAREEAAIARQRATAAYREEQLLARRQSAAEAPLSTGIADEVTPSTSLIDEASPVGDVSAPTQAGKVAQTADAPIQADKVTGAPTQAGKVAQTADAGATVGASPRVRAAGTPVPEAQFARETALTKAINDWETARKQFFEALPEGRGNFQKVNTFSDPDAATELAVMRDRAMTPERQAKYREIYGREFEPYDPSLLPEAPQGIQDLGSGPIGVPTVAGKARKQVVRELDDAYEGALERAAAAPDDASRAAALEEAQRIEQRLGTESLPDDLIGDVARASDVITKYEKASAALADAVGDAASPGSAAAKQALESAEDEATKRLLKRTMRAAEDAEMHGPALSPKMRVERARDAKMAAQVKFDEARAQEMIARRTYRDAESAVKQRRAELKKSASTPANGKKGAGAAELGGLVELLDLPGMPKPSDLPVVGPLLGMYLKYRTVKAALGRFTGRVPATAARASAALAAKTKDKVARSVDRMLGLVETGARRAQPHAPKVFAALGQRVYDDGEPDAPKGASIREQAAVRARELAAYAANPDAIARDVRRELRDVQDPDLIDAAVKHRTDAIQYLSDNAPKMPSPNPLVKQRWEPSGAEAMKLARRLEVFDNPEVAFAAASRGDLTIEAAETLRAVYPKLFALAQDRVLEQAQRNPLDVAYRTRAIMSILFDAQLDPSLDPVNVSIIQSSFTGPVPTGPEPAQSGGPPTPAVAGDVSVNNMYQTTADRAASRR